MIVPISKYHFAVYHREYDEFIMKLREIGLFHIQEIKALPEELKQKKLELNNLKQILDFHETSWTNQEPNGKELPALITNDWLDLIEQHEQLKKEIDSLVLEKSKLAEKWGEFSSELILNLESKGLYLHFYSCKRKAFKDSWENKHGALIFAKDDRKTLFVVPTDQSNRPNIEAKVERSPERGTQEFEHIIAQKKQELEEIKRQLRFFWNHNDKNLRYTVALLSDQLHLNTASHQSSEVGEGSIRLLQAWIPKDEGKAVNLKLDEAEILYEVTDPDPTEKNPIILKNNAYGKLFEPVSNLFSLPNYAELDLTPLFAPFFTLFFGFCLGDAGYGLIILIGISIFGKRLGEQNKGIIRLAQVLGAATIVFGSLTGTLFGIDLASNSIEFIPDGVKNFFLGPDQLFNLSLVLGAFQILFGMVVKIFNLYRQYGFVYTLSTAGWILLVVGLGMIGLDIVAQVGTVLSLIGVGVILLFNDPKANILTRIGKGLWELYGITGIFGDLLSYIRLFALGLSSSILGLVINDIGSGFLDMNPILGTFLFIVFMIIGHGLNLFIAGLGAFVHPMRLTFVEFYKNAGFAGGGMKYNPFKKEIT